MLEDITVGVQVELVRERSIFLANLHTKLACGCLCVSCQLLFVVTFVHGIATTSGCAYLIQAKGTPQLYLHDKC